MSILNCKPDGEALCYFEYAYDLPAPRLRRAGAADRFRSETWRAAGGGRGYGHWVQSNTTDSASLVAFSRLW